MRYCQACHRCYGDGVEYCLFDQTSTNVVEFLPLIIDGKYRLEQLIAQGGMGAVYRATHLQLDRGVAIKILRAEFLSDPTISERFKREARAVARLKHPNIVAIYDYGMLQPGGAYLVMELIEGRSLREEMRTHATSNGQMRPERAASILAQICAGVEAAHRLQIVHRDLKPDNVMIETTDDGMERVLVLDFGIAKLKDWEHAPQGLTDENTVVGTPNYISPEQCTGQPVDARSDVYSLGVILYEMLTGRAPFASQNTSTVLLRHLQEPPVSPSRFRAGLNRELERVVLRALAKNPNQRFQSAMQLAEHLMSAVRGPASEVDPDFDPEEEETLPRHAPAAIKVDEAQGSDQAWKARAPELPLSWPPPPHSPALPLPPPAPVPPPPPPPPPPPSPSWLSEQSGAEESLIEGEREDLALLVEHGPRTKLYLSLAVIALLMLGAAWYLWKQDWQAQIDAVRLHGLVVDPGPQPGLQPGLQSNKATDAKSADPPARFGTDGVQAPGQVMIKEPGRFNSDASSKTNSEGEGKPGQDMALKTSSPLGPVKGESSVPVESTAKREVRTLYNDWALAAVRGDWSRHMSFYGDKVEYFSNGLMARSAIDLRKRRIFSGLDSYSLHFSESPQVTLKNFKGLQEADVIFSRRWELRRGRKRVHGEARGLITLRRDSHGWRIVSERQIKK